MALTVLNVAYPLAPVGPHVTGGAEQIVAHLDAALCRHGHRSVVVACADSVVRGTLLPTLRWHGAITDAVRTAVQERHQAKIAEAVDRWPIDLVHLHGVDFDQYLPPPGVPTLVTLHLPPSWYAPRVFHLARPQTYLHCVSASQRRTCPADAALLPEIENGVSLRDYYPSRCKRNYCVALGRICPEKGFHLALDAADRAGLPLYLAGALFRYPAHEKYFREAIEPRLGHRHRLLHSIGVRRKRRLLAMARCLLLPSVAPETSSLAAREALACGTPVVAFARGALVELIEHGRTGYLVHDTDEMADAIDACRAISPQTCREAAQQRCDATRMTDQYLARYEELVRDACVRDLEGRA